MLTKSQLDLLLPHTGSMSLLEQVTHWDATSITCSAISHTQRHNPLRKNNSLASLNAIEYAAQAMAIHNTLLGQQNCANTKPRVGFLATVSKIQCLVSRLDTLTAPLSVYAKCLTASGDGSLYEFTLWQTLPKKIIITGQAMVMLAP